jgi:integrase
MKAHLTKRYIENLESNGKRLWVSDDETRGLTLIVTPKGVKSFYLVRKFRHKVEQNFMGRFPELSVQEARKRAMHLQVQYDQGISPRQERQQLEVIPSLDAFELIYYEQHLKPNTKHPERNHNDYLRYVSPTFGHMRLDEITRPDIKALMHQYGVLKGQERTANILHSIIRRLFSQAIGMDYYAGQNPATYVIGYKHRRRSRVLLPDELPRFHAALAQEPNSVIRQAISMLLYTGARKMNVFAMHWGDIEVERRVWTIPDTKNGEPHTVALTDEAMHVLAEAKPRCSVYVFPSSGKTGHIMDIKGAWQRLLDRAGIDELWLHDLRRTVGTYMANLGANQAQIAHQLGHKDLQSARSYVFPQVEFVRPATERVTQFLAMKD